MKKYLSGLITGVLASALVFSASVAALAASGNVSFNLSAIKFNGEVISEAGEDYTLPNGCAAPASITYTDEKGGGTTYLPVRRIGELAGVTIDWDGAVVVKTEEFVEKEERDAERAAALDYSDWSAEDEAAYQEFKGLWEYKVRGVGEYREMSCVSFACISKDHISDENLKDKIDQAKEAGFLYRLGAEIKDEYGYTTSLWFYNDTAKELTEWGSTPGCYLGWFDCRY